MEGGREEEEEEEEEEWCRHGLIANRLCSDSSVFTSVCVSICVTVWFSVLSAVFTSSSSGSFCLPPLTFCLFLCVSLFPSHCFSFIFLSLTFILPLSASMSVCRPFVSLTLVFLSPFSLSPSVSLAAFFVLMLSSVLHFSLAHLPPVSRSLSHFFIKIIVTGSKERAHTPTTSF